MALHNSFKQGQSQQQGTRLAGLPNTDDLSQALSQASKSSKRPVLISWKSSKSSAVFWLSVTASGVGNDVEWLLQKGEENTQPKDVWTHKTADTKLIQSLIAAEDEMASKGNYITSQRPPANNEEISESSGSHGAVTNFNQPDNGSWNSGSNAPIVLGGGLQSQTPRSGSEPITPQWQGTEAPPWNVPKATEEHISWSQKSKPDPPSGPNPFAALKGTAEEPKPANPFNALMSNPNLPQLPPQAQQTPQMQQSQSQQLQQQPQAQQSQSQQLQKLPQAQQEPQDQQELYGSSLPKDDPSANPYDALTNSSTAMKKPAAAPPPPPSQPPAPPAVPTKSTSPFTISNSAVPMTPTGNHAPVPRVPDFAAMTSSGAYPTVSVPQENALNPKMPQSKQGLHVNHVSAPPSPAPAAQAKTPQGSTNSGSRNQPPPVPAPGQSSGQHRAQTEAPAASPQSAAQQSLSSSRNKPLPAPVELDRSAVDTIFKTLSNPETGLLTHSSLLFFLVREFNRFQVSKEPFGLILLEMNVLISNSTGQQLPRPLPPRAVRAATEKLFKVTRQLDLVTHYDQLDYAMLLPTTNRQQAAEFAQTVSKALLSQPLLPDMEPKSLIVHMGVACFPEDTSHPGILLAAARDAKQAAQQSGKPVVHFWETDS